VSDTASLCRADPSPQQTHQTSGNRSRSSRFARGAARAAGQSAGWSADRSAGGAHGCSAKKPCVCAASRARGARHWPASPPATATLQRNARQSTRCERVARERPGAERDIISVSVPHTRSCGRRDNASRHQITPGQRRGVLRFLKRRRRTQQGYAAAGCGLRTAAGGAAERAWSMRPTPNACAPKPSRAQLRGQRPGGCLVASDLLVSPTAFARQELRQHRPQAFSGTRLQVGMAAGVLLHVPRTVWNQQGRTVGGARLSRPSAPGGMNAGELADGAAFDARLGSVDAENVVLLGARCCTTPRLLC
jgi:hypothetical protein